MLNKTHNSSGQKAYQRNDMEDRSLPYRNWLRTVKTNGYYTDIDLIKWRNGNPVAITDITRCDRFEITPSYLKAIEERIFKRDSQGKMLTTMGELLKVPVYLVCFQKDLRWMYVYSFNKKTWKEFTPDQWANHLSKL